MPTEKETLIAIANVLAKKEFYDQLRQTELDIVLLLEQAKIVEIREEEHYPIRIKS